MPGRLAPAHWLEYLAVVGRERPDRRPAILRRAPHSRPATPFPPLLATFVLGDEDEGAAGGASQQMSTVLTLEDGARIYVCVMFLGASALCALSRVDDIGALHHALGLLALAADRGERATRAAVRALLTIPAPLSGLRISFPVLPPSAGPGGTDSLRTRVTLGAASHHGLVGRRAVSTAATASSPRTFSVRRRRRAG